MSLMSGDVMRSVAKQIAEYNNWLNLAGVDAYARVELLKQIQMVLIDHALAQSRRTETEQNLS